MQVLTFQKRCRARNEEGGERDRSSMMTCPSSVPDLLSTNDTSASTKYVVESAYMAPRGQAGQLPGTLALTPAGMVVDRGVAAGWVEATAGVPHTSSICVYSSRQPGANANWSPKHKTKYRQQSHRVSWGFEHRQTPRLIDTWITCCRYAQRRLSFRGGAIFWPYGRKQVLNMFLMVLVPSSSASKRRYAVLHPQYHQDCLREPGLHDLG
jgi:hypothetical protein